MKKISDFNDATDKYPVVYAGSATRPEFVNMPTIRQQQEGVVPMDTLPAQWWNAMWKLATKDINAFRDYVGDAFTEINNLLTKFDITLEDANSSQLYDFFHNAYVQNYLNDIFVNKNGDTINGDLHIKGNLSVDGIGLEKMSHNIPRLIPKDITSYITDGTFWKRLAGTGGYALFEDIYVGDYFKMSRPISAYERTGQYQTTGSQYVTIAGLDTMMYNGDQGNNVNYHHAVMVAGQGFGGTQHFGRSRMNATNTTEGGYKASEMNMLVLGEVTSTGSTATDATINQQLYAEFGSHLKTTRELVSNAINATGYNRFGSATGCASNWEWISAQAILMSEIEVYGSIAWSSAGYDTGNANIQLPLFAFSKQAQNNRSAYWWLKDIASAEHFCNVRNYGYAGSYSTSFSGYYIRPRFIIA